MTTLRKSKQININFFLIKKEIDNQTVLFEKAYGLPHKLGRAIHDSEVVMTHFANEPTVNQILHRMGL